MNEEIDLRKALPILGILLSGSIILLIFVSIWTYEPTCYQVKNTTCEYRKCWLEHCNFYNCENNFTYNNVEKYKIIECKMDD